jgi:hypothetical protein
MRASFLHGAAALVGLCAMACAGAPVAPAASPTTPTKPPAASSAAPPVAVAPEPARGLPPLSAGTPEPPASCAAFVDRAPVAARCDDRPSALTTLADALAQKDQAARDAALRGLEGCTQLPAGALRALRAELAPVECGDALVASVAAARTGKTDVDDLLMGLGLAARLARLAAAPPTLSAPFDKARFVEFAQRTLLPWIDEQARAIHAASLVGSRLAGYGKAVVAVEAGLADLRFVERVRGVPLPAELAKDVELKDVYYGTLDQALEPRKTRGRDAALVGLRLLAEVGVLRDARLDRARALLSSVYGGRRVDALDALLLPPLGAPPAATEVELRLARDLPTYYTGLLLPGLDATRAPVLRALLERGLPFAARRQLEQSALDGATRALTTRARFTYGQRYVRAVDLKRAGELAELGANVEGPTGAESKLFAALGAALAGGPQDAAALVAGTPLLAKPGDVSRLDELGASKSALAGHALYDAALLLTLAPPPDAGKDYWDGIATRYERAAKLLTAPAERREAQARGKAARETGKAVAAGR